MGVVRENYAMHAIGNRFYLTCQFVVQAVKVVRMLLQVFASPITHAHLFDTLCCLGHPRHRLVVVDGLCHLAGDSTFGALSINRIPCPAMSLEMREKASCPFPNHMYVTLVMPEISWLGPLTPTLHPAMYPAASLDLGLLATLVMQFLMFWKVK